MNLQGPAPFLFGGRSSGRSALPLPLPYSDACWLSAASRKPEPSELFEDLSANFMVVEPVSSEKGVAGSVEDKLCEEDTCFCQPF